MAREIPIDKLWKEIVTRKKEEKEKPGVLARD